VKIGAIVGGVLGGLALIAIVVVALYWVRRRHPREKPKDLPSTVPASSDYGYAVSAVGRAPMVEMGQPPTREMEGKMNQVYEMRAGDAHEMPASTRRDASHR
jgi:hypothetical protein